jgi:DNA-binding NarL/FixJ family response regulator
MRTEHGNAVTAVVIDSHHLRQQHSRALLQRRAIDVVGLATAVDRAAELVDLHACDLLFVRLDAGSEPGTVYSALRKAHKHRPTLVTVAVVEDDDPAVVEAALAAGVYATIGRAAGLQEVARLAFAGLMEQRGNGNGNGCSAARARLTRREIEILRLVAEGRSNREVARLLWVTDQTVKFHLANTYRKLGVSNRGEASEWAVARGLVREQATRAARAERTPLTGLVARGSRRPQGDAVAVTP